MGRLIGVGCLLALLSALPWGLSAQEFSPPGKPGESLESAISLLEETQRLIESIESDSERQRETLESALGLLRRQGELIGEQARTQEEQSRISRRQSELLKKTLFTSKALKIALAVSMPACAGLGLWAGLAIARR